MHNLTLDGLKEILTLAQRLAALTFFSSSADRPESVSISASLSVTDLSACTLDDCWTPSSNSETADDVADSVELFTSLMSRCNRALQTDIASWQ
jgi:hypothetical protein